jgi:hypothetical protein
MATVPIQTLPGEQLSSQGPGQVAAGPAVVPFENKAPDQINAFGQAVAKAGSAVTDIAVKMQDQFNDARSKQLYTAYSGEVQEIETQFMAQKGAAAGGTTYQSAQDLLKQSRDKYQAAAENDVIGRMFMDRSDVLINSSSGQMTRHSITEQNAYNVSEGKAEITTNLQNAARYWADYTNPDGNFNTYAAAAIAQVDALADSQSLPAKSHQRAQMKLEAYTELHSNVVQQMMGENKFVVAKEYLDDKVANNEMSRATYLQLNNALEVGVARERGIDVGTSVFEGAAKQTPINAGTFDAAAGHVLMIEGGYVENDAGAGPTKYGINGKANGLTRDQVLNLTKAEALEIYKTQYWDKVGIDKLPVEVRNMAFDAAVNQGQSAARSMIRSATKDDGTFDTAMFMALRQERYAATLNSERFLAMPQAERDAYKLSWERRVQSSANNGNIALDPKTGLPNLNGMVTQIRETMPAGRERDVAIAQVTDMFNEQDKAIKQQYENNLFSAEKIALSAPGAYAQVPAVQWAALTEPDRQRLIAGPQRGSDPNVELDLIKNPNLTLPGQIERYRSKLSESTYQSFVASGIKLSQTAPNTRSATVPSAMLNSALISSANSLPARSGFDSTDLNRLLDPQSDDDKQDLINLNYTLQSRIDEAQTGKNRELTFSEKKEIVDNVLLDEVFYDDMGLDDTQYRFFEFQNATPSELKNLYVYGQSQQPDGSYKTIKVELSNIPREQVADITSKYRIAYGGRYPTQMMIANEWLNRGKPRN